MLNFPAAMSDEEIKKMGLLSAGNYKFRVLSAESQVSKTGNPMIKLSLRVFNSGNGEGVNLNDYLLTTSRSMMFKLKHFCLATGLDEKFNNGTLSADDCLTREGFAYIEIQKGQQKDGGGFYDDKNAVVDYLKPEQLEENSSLEFNDTIPF